MAKKIFNEKKYQKNRKVLNIIGVSWIVLVITISSILTIVGAYNAKKINDEAKTTISNAVEEQTNNSTEIELPPPVPQPLIDVSDYKGPTNQAELDLALSEIEAKHTIAMAQPGWFEDNSAKNKELMRMNSDYNAYISKVDQNERAMRRQADAEADYESEMVTSTAKAAQDIINKAKSAQDNMTSVFDGIVIGGMTFFSIITLLMIDFILCTPGFALLFIANSRSIYGFVAQSSVPVAKESTKQMAPAFGSVAKEITKGIKSGFSDTGKKKNKK